MKCPRCNAADTKVVDSREVRDGVRRRRECTGCGFRFTTRERFDFTPVTVVKRSGRTEVFDRAKIVKAVTRVAGKRQVALAAIEQLSFDVERAFMSLSGDPRVTTGQIAWVVAQELRKLDAVAARRFRASYEEGGAATLVKPEAEAAPERPATRQLELFGAPPSDEKR
jgi:transcriptional repressor NrdR